MPALPPTSRAAGLWRGVLVAAGYALCGKLSLELAIPPGYATAVWPPAGIAVAALFLWGGRTWLAVWAGSFAVNFWVSGSTESAERFFFSALICAVIATGATAQGLVGARLIRWKVRWPALLDTESEIAWFLFLAGPLSCLISASVGVTCLLSADLLAFDRVLFNWTTWWVGDTIGVLIFAPLLLLLCASPRAAWRGRAVTIGVPLVIAFACTVVFFVIANRLEKREQADAFTRRAEGLNQAIKRRINDYLDVIHAVETFFASSVAVDRAEFRTFVAPMLARYPGLHAVSFNRCVKRDERAEFEDVQKQEVPGFQISEFDGAGQLVRAGDRPEYVVVTYLEPHAGNEIALGFDAASVPARQAALATARDQGAAVATRPLRLVQERSGQPGVLVYLPVFQRGASTAGTTQSPRPLIGYVTGVLRTGPMIDAFLLDTDHEGIELHIQDTTDESNPVALFSSARRAAASDSPELVTTQTFGGRTWRFEFTGDPAFLNAQRSWSAWFVLAGGLMLTGLLGGFLLVLTGRTSRVEQTVALRTGELKSRNEELASLNRKLEERSREVIQLSYAMTHDLQTPLATLSGSMDVLTREIGGLLDGPAGKWMSQMQGATARMARMLDDLMQYARAGSENMRRESVSIAAVLGEIVAELDLVAARKGIRLEWDGGDARVVANAQGLGRVFTNLLWNAIKFAPAGGGGRIAVRTAVSEGSVEVAVADNGPGVSVDQLEEVFLPFKRGTSSAVGGTGLGLSTVRRFVEAFGGRVWLESDGRSGTTAKVVLPLAPAECELMESESNL